MSFLAESLKAKGERDKKKKMPDRREVLPRMDAIVKIIVSNEQNVPGNCLECRFSDGDLFGEWFCVNNRKIDFLMARPDWCPMETVESQKSKVERESKS